LRKLERAKITPPPNWLEDQVQEQKMFYDSRAASEIVNPTALLAVCVLLAAKERAQCISAPDVTWACAWCLISRNITQK